MATPKPRSGRSTSLREPGDNIRLTESEKIEGTGSWETLEWTKIEPAPRSVPEGLLGFLLEAEQVIVEVCIYTRTLQECYHYSIIVRNGKNPGSLLVLQVWFQGYGVVLVNTDEAGTLFVTNYRLLFLSEGSRNIIPLGTIPLATIEKFNKIAMKLPSAPRQSDRAPSRRLLQVIGAGSDANKGDGDAVVGFSRRAVFDALVRCTRPVSLWDLYAVSSRPSRFSNTNPTVRLLNEYFRLLGMVSCNASASSIEDGSYTVSNEWWRISAVNSTYTMCPTYPFALLVPKCISDEEVLQASTFRARCRLPVISWCHPGNGAVLARSSQPLVGLMMNMRSNADEKLVASLCTHLAGPKQPRRKLYIADARPRKNALANGAMGGGSESSSNYFQSEIVFFGIENIHAMRDSLSRLRDYLDTHGATSSDGMSSFLRHGGWTWGGGNLSSMSASVSTLGDTGWLIHVQNVLAGSAWIAARIALESASVLVHCSDGWDRTTQLISLANLLLDPYYRTFKGFQALVEKDWLAFGHPFADRMGMPTSSGGGSMLYELSRQSSTGSFPSSPMRQSSGSSTSQAQSFSGGFLGLCALLSLWKLLVQQVYMPSVSLASDKERQQSDIFDTSGCLWMYLADLRASEGSSHVHYNLFYEPSKHEGPLLPPAAALAPTLWPQFHLRWACPSEAQAGEVEAQCRSLAKKFSELQKAKEAAEMKAKEIAATTESLSAALQNEKQISSSAMNLAKRATKESAAIKRAIQSLGCKVHFSGSGDCTVNIESNQTEIPHKLIQSPSKRESDGNMMQNDDKSDLSVSITVIDEVDSNNPITKVCESLCPLRSRDGGCRWPDAGCAQLGSQFVGLKANFDAFDRLSIYDSYFRSE
ncbi:hypothetical protein RHGRI_007400 [Rhododendron griersonianum]|uniref:phosphatidylinositol-3,5-bisphosphate 3-phosphatase n=1 Tax=Rhododendron griersonianum TaxID=479676 RepID=A0AAV6KXE9_9ERIC|nr:hypothetical protein RHGRI_007400 [Rhododendron griersonianum]